MTGGPSGAVALAATALMLALAFSGCLGGGDSGGIESNPGGGDAGATEGPGATSANPATGSSTSGSSPSPTATSQMEVSENESFEGGAHKHDNWGERTEYVIMDRTVAIGAQGTDVCGAAVVSFACATGKNVIRFESPDDPTALPNNIWPGTGKVTVDVTAAGTMAQPLVLVVWMTSPDGYVHFRHELGDGTTNIVIDNVEENNTDPPHFRTSGWQFTLESAPVASSRATVYVGNLDFLVTIHRSDRPLPIDPPHPDRWEGDTYKVFQQVVVEENVWSTWADGRPLLSSNYYTVTFPEKNDTVLPLTSILRVSVSWDESDPVPSTLGMRFCPAGQPCDVVEYTDPPPPVTDEADHRVWEIEVRPDQWDSPYASNSNWRFEWYFDNGDSAAAVGETGYLQGTVTWGWEILKQE